MLVRTRHSTRDPAQLTGYAVALPGDTTLGPGTQFWYGGGKLAADLTLPKLRRRWPLPGSDDPLDDIGRSIQKGFVGLPQRYRVRGWPRHNRKI